MLKSAFLFVQSLSSDLIKCDRTIDNSVFINTVWLSAACIPPAILLPLLVDKVGFKAFLGTYFKINISLLQNNSIRFHHFIV